MSETDEANPVYALGEWSKALQTAAEHPDGETRDRARAKADSWRGVFQRMLSGLLHIGSRAPIRDTPVWATPEVMKGGFASGRLLAEKPFDPRERELAENLQVEPRRGPLQRGLLSESGLTFLLDRLQGRDYELETPEEAALLVVAWLASHDQLTAAAALVQELEPWMDRLRFFPIRPMRSTGQGLILQDLELTRNNLRCLKPHPQYVAMRRAIRQRKPLLDRLVALWMETRADGWPAQQYPADWAERGHQLFNDWRRLNKNRWAERGQTGTLRHCLAVALLDPGQLSGRQVGKLARAAALPLPLVEELAVDIFQGEFGEKFLRSAQCAARLLHDSPYQRYYRLPVERLLALDDVAPARFKTAVSPGFVALCAYGWRQLVFFVSRLGHDQQRQALEQGLALLEKTPDEFLRRQWEELGRAVAGRPLQSPPWLGWKCIQ
ncbi:hypothetical protein IV102_33040 [bacterium]|nr:hypothetical protein [bacterium]